MALTSLHRAVRFAFLITIIGGAAAEAELVIAPVFNKIEGSGPTQDFDLGLLAHTPLRAPGDHFAYVAGDPRAPQLDTLHFWNDSPYNITGFSLRIIGTGTDTEDPGTIVIDDNVNARFGDVAGYPIASDIFPNVEITENGKAIHFSGGVIPPGGRFTDLHYADSDLVPEIQAFDYAAIDSWFSGELADEKLCLVQGDPVTMQPFNLVDAYCIPPTDGTIGDVGGPASISATGEFAANHAGVVDVFVIWEPEELTVMEGQSFTYSSSVSWTNDHPDARVREWVGNFLLDPPKAFPITDTASPEATPPELTKNGTSATVTNRTFDASQFPPDDIGRYHIQVSGLEPGEIVTFSKTAGGGEVVPEPSSLVLTLLGLGTLLTFARRGSC